MVNITNNKIIIKAIEAKILPIFVIIDKIQLDPCTMISLKTLSIHISSSFISFIFFIFFFCTFI